MTRTRIWIMAAALLAVVASAAGLALAHELSGDAEVRISARRLDDGRTEFALQQRIDGEWAERISPSAKYLPPNPTPGWKNSSPLMIETTPAEAEAGSDTAADTTSEELKAALAEAAEAKSELATAQSETAEAKEALAAAQAALADATAPPMIIRELGAKAYDGGRVTTLVETRGRGGDNSNQWLTTTLSIQADGEYKLSETPPVMAIRCNDSFFEVDFRDLPMNPTVNRWSSKVYIASYQFSPDPHDEPAVFRNIEFGSWEPQGAGSGFIARPDAVARFYHLLLNSESLTIHFEGEDEEAVELTFTLDGVWDTPVQPNLDHCSDYY